MQVKLSPLLGMTNGAIPTEEEVPGVLRVDVYDEALKSPPLSIESGKLHVGVIGRQGGAAFCENDSFRRYLSTSQQDQVVREVSRQHGSVSDAQPVSLPDIEEEPAEEYDDE